MAASKSRFHTPAIISGQIRVSLATKIRSINSLVTRALTNAYGVCSDGDRNKRQDVDRHPADVNLSKQSFHRFNLKISRDFSLLKQTTLVWHCPRETFALADLNSIQNHQISAPAIRLKGAVHNAAVLLHRVSNLSFAT